MKDVSMMPVVAMPRIGVDMDGNPVVYDPEKAAAKRAEIVAQIREKNGIPEDRFLTVSFTPELERGYVRASEEDTVELGEKKIPNRGVASYNQSVAALKIPPKIVDAATDAFAEFITKYGPEALVFLAITGWNALFGKNNAEEVPQDTNKDASMQARFEEVA